MELISGWRRYVLQTMRRLIILLAFGLVATACGSGESSAVFQSSAPTTATTVPAVIDETSTTTDGSPAATAPSDGVTTTVPQAAPTELPGSDYPDVVVADLAGGEVNLRELVLEPRPVLLWFWAPH
jgi:hypothetical protein